MARSLTTNERPRNIDSVPSVTMSTGSRSPTARTPLISPSTAPKAMPAGGDERIEPVADHQGRDDGGEVEHPADRQVDLADGQEEDHAEREDAEERVAGRQVEQIVGVDEGRLDRPDEGDEHAEGNEHAELFGKPTVTAGLPWLGEQLVRRVA